MEVARLMELMEGSEVVVQQMWVKERVAVCGARNKRKKQDKGTYVVGRLYKLASLSGVS